MPHIKQLKDAAGLRDIAHLLGFKPAALSYILYIKKDKYTTFEISKRGAGQREICAPTPELKNLQRRLSNLLQDCISEINTDKEKPDTLSHGFKRNRSIITNANQHKNKRFVLNLDLQNFFGTINFGRVRGFFIKNNNFKLDEKVATILAQIACYENSLPQGSPCSPVISNLITHPLDIRLASIANKFGCQYSRYADDITFSTNLRKFPTKIAKLKEPTSHQWLIGNSLSREINRSGFSINPTKTRMLYKENRQDVTGLIVNKKVGIKSEYWRNARSMVHKLLTTGEYYITDIERDKDGKTIVVEKQGSINQLNGILSFIHSTETHNDQILKANKKHPPFNSRKKTYKDFLFYINFYIQEKPVVICEGKTDNVYLSIALKKLYKQFPELVEVDTENQIKKKIKFFRYTKISETLLHLSGGTGELNKFVSSYSRQIKKYHKEKPKNPVIVILDNDSGAKSMFSIIKEKTGSKNKINGKSLSLEQNFDTEKFYGKSKFAKQVVQKKQDTINFDKFSIIFKNIKLLLDHYKAI